MSKEVNDFVRIAQRKTRNCPDFFHNIGLHNLFYIGEGKGRRVRPEDEKHDVPVGVGAVCRQAALHQRLSGFDGG